MKYIYSTLFFLSFIFPVYALPVDNQASMDMKNFSNWKGVAFSCTYDGESKHLEEICSRSSRNAELVARSLNVPIVLTRVNEIGEAIEKSFENGLVLLVLRLTTVDSSALSDVPVFIELSFSALYLNAIEMYPVVNEFSMPARSGMLKLWNIEYSGSVRASVFVEVVTAKIDDALKSAFLVYSKNSR